MCGHVCVLLLTFFQKRLKVGCFKNDFIFLQRAENVAVFVRISCIFLRYSIFRLLIMWWDFRIRDSLLPVKLPSPCFLLQQQQQQEDFKRQLNKYKNLFAPDWISFNSMSPQAAGVRCCCLSLVPLTAEHLHLFLRSSYETSCLLATSEHHSVTVKRYLFQSRGPILAPIF